MTFLSKDTDMVLKMLLYFDANIEKSHYKEIASLGKVKLFYSNEKGVLTKEEKESKKFERCLAQSALVKENMVLRVRVQ